MYIHDYAFQVLAADPAVRSGRVAHALMSAKAMRVVGHHLESAAELALLSDDTVARVASALGSQLYEPLAELLRGLKLRGQPTGSHLLTGDETLVASCFDSGYWTFATTPEAAARMYADHEPLRALYERHMNGTGPSDLAMIRGARLEPAHERIGAPSKQRDDRLVRRSNWTTSCRQALQSTSTDIARLVASHLPSADDTGARLSIEIDLALKSLAAVSTVQSATDGNA